MTTGGSEPGEGGAAENEGSRRIHEFEEFCGETCFLPGVEKQKELRGFSEHSFGFLIKWKMAQRCLAPQFCLCGY